MASMVYHPNRGYEEGHFCDEPHRYSGCPQCPHCHSVSKSRDKADLEKREAAAQSANGLRNMERIQIEGEREHMRRLEADRTKLQMAVRKLLELVVLVKKKPAKKPAKKKRAHK